MGPLAWSGGTPDAMHLRGRQRVFAAFPQHRAVTADLHGPLLARAQTVPALVLGVEHLGGQTQTVSPRLPVPVFNEGPQARIQSHDNMVAAGCMREKALNLAERRESRIYRDDEHARGSGHQNHVDKQGVHPWW